MNSKDKRNLLLKFGFRNIPEEWSTPLMGELLQQERGISVGVMYPGENCLPSGIPLIKAGDLKNNWINPKPDFSISRAKHDEYVRTELEGGELLISLVGNAGQTAIVPERMKGWNVARAVAVLRFNKDISTKYIQYALQSYPLQSLMKAWCNTTVQETLNLKEIRQLPLPLPNRYQQEGISHILGTIDNKIEINKKTNETIEEITKALFKSWFIDFHPVRTKADGRSTGLPDEICALFPDSFENSKSFEIPSGWKESCLSDIFSIQGGSQPPAKTFIEYEKEGYIRLLQIRDFLGDNHMTYVPFSKNLRLVDEDDVLIGRYGSGNGKFMDDSLGRPLRGLSGAINVAIVETHPKQKNMIELIYAMVLSGWFYRQVVGGSSRAVQAGFRKEDLDLIPFALPPNDLLDVFQSIGSDFWQRSKLIYRENKSLSSLRNTLLVKLISGELRIPDAEKMIEEVGI